MQTSPSPLNLVVPSQPQIQASPPDQSVVSPQSASPEATPQFEVLPPPLPPLSSPNEPLPTPAIPAPARKSTRNGKIARLPKLERDMVNRMLRNNLRYSLIVGALDEVGLKVTERNVSNWKTRGGYREWCLQQDQALQVRLFQDNLTDYLRKGDAGHLPEVGLQLASTWFSEFLLKPETRQQFAADPDKFSRMVSTLCRLSQNLHAFQKYRDDSAKELGYKYVPERARRADEAAVESVRKTFSSKIGNGPNDPDIPHRNYLPAGSQ